MLETGLAKRIDQQRKTIVDVKALVPPLKTLSQFISIIIETEVYADNLHGAQRAQNQSQWFLMTAQRWDLGIIEALGFGQGWQDFLLDDVSNSGRLAHTTGIDSWVYPKGMPCRP